MTRILLIEDNRNQLEVMRRTLTEAGINVTCMGSAEEALQRFDLILCDISMPDGMGGLEFAEEVKRTGAFPGVPLVSISSACTPRQQALARGAGFSALIEKPINAKLAEKVLEFVK